MKKSLLSAMILLSVITRASAQNCASQSNIISFSHNGHSYELVKEMASWTAAAACAVERGGHLVHINDSSEQTAIINAIGTSGISSTYTSVFDGGGVAYIWMGATDKLLEGTWIWDGDNNSTGTNFWQGEGTAGSGGGTIIAGAYNNWGRPLTSSIPNEPDDYNNSQDAAAIGLTPWPASSSTKYGYAGEWNDINTTNQLYYIIEKLPSSIMPDAHTEFSISVHPNPSKDILHISYKASERGKYALYTLNGQKLQEGTISNKMEIPLPAGQYLLQIITSKASVTQKVLIY